MKYAKTLRLKLIEISHEDCRRVILISVAFAVIMLVSYGYLVAATVSNMVAYNDAKSNISEISSELSGLELKYTSLSKSLTEERALENGLVINTNTHFIVLGPDAKSSLADASTVVR
ncbi:MAG: hypothetical protein HZA95_01255 [Candidatus Vogelbacteria bacterium]|nr:hypothetical protein [Candidatus Vogelbacteria bacterium]